jgi:probable HAF family extracellular repeat protein
MGDLSGGPFNSLARGVSDDGRVIIGNSQSALGHEAFRWAAETGMLSLGLIPDPFETYEAHVVSGDGRVIAGSGYVSAEVGWELWRWTPEDGLMIVPDPFGNWNYTVTGITPDGGIMVANGTGRQVIWDAEHGLRELEPLLDEAGLDLLGFNITTVEGVSADGRTFCGNALNAAGVNEGWVAYLGPPPCPADLDGDGFVALADLARLIGAYGVTSGATPEDGDLDADGDVDLSDLAALLNVFGEACG